RRPPRPARACSPPDSALHDHRADLDRAAARPRLGHLQRSSRSAASTSVYPPTISLPSMKSPSFTIGWPPRKTTVVAVSCPWSWLPCPAAPDAERTTAPPGHIADGAARASAHRTPPGRANRRTETRTSSAHLLSL